MITVEAILPEVQFKAIRSSGSGGQHVNKVSTKIELRFNLLKSTILTETHKELLLKTISERLTKEHIIILHCDETRSQHRNKELVVRRLLDILNRGLIEPKMRKPTKLPRAVKLKRLKNKKQQSDKKVARRKPNVD